MLPSDRRDRGAWSQRVFNNPLAFVEASRSPTRSNSVLRRHPVSTSESGGHLIQSRCIPAGGRQITLTKLAPAIVQHLAMTSNSARLIRLNVTRSPTSNRKGRSSSSPRMRVGERPMIHQPVGMSISAEN